MNSGIRTPLAKKTIKAEEVISLQNALPGGAGVRSIRFSACDYPALGDRTDDYESIVFKGTLTGAPEWLKDRGESGGEQQPAVVKHTVGSSEDSTCDALNIHTHFGDERTQPLTRVKRAVATGNV